MPTLRELNQMFDPPHREIFNGLDNARDKLKSDGINLEIIGHNDEGNVYSPEAAILILNGFSQFLSGWGFSTRRNTLKSIGITPDSVNEVISKLN